MFTLVHLVGHLAGDPARVHGIDVRVEDHRIEVPHQDRERSQPRLPEVDHQRHVEHALGEELDEPIVEPEHETSGDHHRRPPRQCPVLRLFDIVETLDRLHFRTQAEVVEHSSHEELKVAPNRHHVMQEPAAARRGQEHSVPDHGQYEHHRPDPVEGAADLKIVLINRLSAAGLTTIEVSSFVSPRRVPQMADAAKVLSGIKRFFDVRYPVLVPNRKGLEAALSAGAEEIAVFVAVSETFSGRNINCSIAQSLERVGEVAELALSKGVKVRGYISCVAGCPYEGDVAPAAVADLALRLRELGCYEISLGDTIGVGTPGLINAMGDEKITQRESFL